MATNKQTNLILFILCMLNMMQTVYKQNKAKLTIKFTKNFKQNIDESQK